MNDTTPQTTLRSPDEHHKLVAVRGWKAEQSIKRGVNFLGVILCTVLLGLAFAPWILMDSGIDIASYAPHAVIGLGAIFLLTGLVSGISRAATRRQAAPTEGSTTPHTP